MNKPNIKIDCEYRELEVEVMGRHDIETYKCIYNGRCIYQSQATQELVGQAFESRTPKDENSCLTTISCTLKISDLERELNEELFKKGDFVTG